MNRGTDYTLDPANKAEILAVLPADGDRATAERIYQMWINEARGGLIRNLNLDRKGLLATAQLRQTWHGWDSPLELTWVASKQSGVYDMSYWRRALQSLGQAAGDDGN